MSRVLRTVEDGVVTYDVCDDLDQHKEMIEIIASIAFAIMPAEDKVEDLKEYLRIHTKYGDCEECGLYHIGDK